VPAATSSSSAHDAYERTAKFIGYGCVLNGASRGRRHRAGRGRLPAAGGGWPAAGWGRSL